MQAEDGLSLDAQRTAIAAYCSNHDLQLIAYIKTLFEGGIGSTRVAAMLNEQKIPPPQGKVWTLSLVYNLKLRLGWQTVKPHSPRNHTDQEVKARMTELRNSGRTCQQVANLVNEEGSSRWFGGLAYWGGTLYGFTVAGHIFAIDPGTARTTEVLIKAPAGTRFDSAGVTTGDEASPARSQLQSKVI